MTDNAKITITLGDKVIGYCQAKIPDLLADLVAAVAAYLKGYKDGAS